MLNRLSRWFIKNTLNRSSTASEDKERLLAATSEGVEESKMDDSIASHARQLPKARQNFKEQGRIRIYGLRRS
ncbi:hypothetical protein NEOLI_001116 [Neolecta irregularis DAH-3]|uniref:Uncharacterized protein n=1 Tax=Neolecta irregularis (strain DAH-3) TaxID=1198029 RepID=A0A1U7LUX2_NEOID|nr:hypothetical protein NEOLI_001116 [Neolecta irregularis DAH-3]|eukprot:OLL26457.1 hypothetical protein NEOLI_001116 [Neolecta irregularis DAH-3]